MGANSFILELTPFYKVLDMLESKNEVKIVVSLLQLAVNQPHIISSLKIAINIVFKKRKK